MVMNQASERFSTGTRWIEIPSDVRCGLSVLEAIVCELNLAGFDRKQIRAIELAFTEALVNAVRHGNQDDPRKMVMIEYCIELDGLRLAIEDEGYGYCPDEIEDPTQPEHLQRPGGRGLFLIRSLIDEVAFNGRGNRIVMRQSKRARTAA